MPVDSIERLIITGGNGYIGARVAELAEQDGRQVVLLGRTPPEGLKSAIFIPWKLGEPLPAAAVGPSGTRMAVIHLAHDWRNTPGPSGEEGHLNITGTEKLLNSARAFNIERFVFVSSQSARQDSLNIYGRVKWQIEKKIEARDTVSARVGLVYGGPKKAMYGLICTLVRRLPMIPMVCSGQQVQPIHLDEVCRGLLLLADSPLTGRKGLAGPQPLAFGDVLRTIGREVYGRRIIIMPVPLSLALLAARMTAYIPFIPTVDKERILGLAGTRFTPSADDLAAIGLNVSPMQTGLRRSAAGRKALLAEGKTLLHYVLGCAPSPLLQKLYVKAARVSDPEAGAIGLFPFFMAFPVCLRFIEPLNAKRPLAQRMRLAAALVDASAEGVRILQAQSRTMRMAKLAVTLIGDVLVLPIRLLAGILAHD